METESNPGGTFQYDSKERGDKLARYLSKEVSFRGGGGPRPVKWPPEWVPKRISNRLWFSRGLTNAGSKEGREINKKRAVLPASVRHPLTFKVAILWLYLCNFGSVDGKRVRLCQETRTP